MRLLAPIVPVFSLLLCCAANSDEYFVDFDEGADTNRGTGRNTPWKHCPGDPQAGAVAGSVELAPGDVVRFKGGIVYRRMIEVRASGLEGKPILYDGNSNGTWGTGRAVIDGSEPVTGWRKCAGPEDADNSPHWRNLYYTWLPADTDVLTLNLCDGQTMLYLAQSTNPPTPFRMDDPKLLWKTDDTDMHDQEQLADPQRLAGKPASAFDDALMYLCAFGMRMAAAKIESYDPAKGQVRYEKIKLRTYPDTRYAILNAVWTLDRPGEYVLKRRPDAQGRLKLLLWPPTRDSLRAITRSVRDTGFDLCGCSHVTVGGFAVRKLSPRQGRIHRGAFTKRQRGSKNEGGSGLTIRDNEISLLWKTPAMYLTILQHSRVEENHVHDCALGGTILLDSANDSVCKNNRLERVGTTGIDFYRCHRSQLIGNQVSDIYGVHANGLTVYLQCSHILVAYDLYGKMPWPKKGKELHAGEMIVAEKERLFRDFDRQDFRPPEHFPGKDKGVAIPRSVLDLPRDIADDPAPTEAVDIGAYQE